MKKELMTKFIYEFTTKSRKKESYKRSLENVARHLEEFAVKNQIKIYTDSLSDPLLEEFVFYLQEQGKLASTIKNIIGKTKYLLDKALMEGKPVPKGYKDFNIKEEEINTLSLTDDEIRDIFRYDQLPSVLDRIKDRFLIGCVTALRYSDYSRLSMEYIHENWISIKTLKTVTPVMIPIHPVLRLILQKYKGILPPPVSIQYFNRGLKEAFQLMGYTQLIPWERKKGGRLVSEMRPKYTFISSHTARRSAATNMYNAGIPAYRIMLITGHKTEASFFRYIRITREENVQTLLKHPYFKGEAERE